MKRRTATACLILFAARSVLAQETKLPPDEIDRRFAAVENAKYQSDVWEIYRELFKDAGESGLTVLKQSRHDSIATQAAWEEVANTIPEEDVPGVYRLDKQKVEWFLGFIEGRGRLTVPKWWRDTVLETKAHHRKNIFLSDPQSTPETSYVIPSLDTIITPACNNYYLLRGQDSVRVPDELVRLNSDGRVSGDFSGYFTTNHCYLTSGYDSGYDHNVYCVDRLSGKTVWKSRACGCWWSVSPPFLDRGWVEVTLQQDRVVVFGVTSLGFYVHAFRVEDGKTLFQFSSGY